jgi:hypothetical protein
MPNTESIKSARRNLIADIARRHRADREFWAANDRSSERDELEDAYHADVHAVAASMKLTYNPNI